MSVMNEIRQDEQLNSAWKLINQVMMTTEAH